MKASLSRRILTRVMVMVLAIVGLGVGAAGTASAATCVTPAHVYANGGHVKWETDPLDGPIDTLYVLYGGTLTLGGNGIEPSEDPFWNVHYESGNGYITTMIGNRTGSNCVSNEKTFNIYLNRGSYIFYAFYYKGDGTPINAQKHFRLVVS